jgi:cysteinyl-tRNA synthetase
MPETPVLKIFNTESRSLEEIEGPSIKMYCCGPTVYNFAHIGNLRTYVFEDLLRRTLKFFGLKVTQAMNITDVEDKIIKLSVEKNCTIQELTEPFTRAFFEDLKTLNIESVEFYPRATEYIPEMIRIIEKLLKLGVAYRGHDESIYYSIKHFPSYGRLSHLQLDELKLGVSEKLYADEYDKENAADFVLWKSYDPQRDGKVFWESPFGKGRPGWHIECSAMAMKNLGETIDIHVGGVDNMFPHHENEIAQSEAFSGQRFVRHWIHCEHLLVDHKKMSKSLGNFYTLRDLLQKGYKGPEVRYMLMQTHYRVQLNFTFEGLDGAVHSLERLSDFYARIKGIQQEQEGGEVASMIQHTSEAFTKALADDLNISVALAAIYELVRKINALCDLEKVGKAEAQELIKFLNRLDTVLGIFSFGIEEEIPEELQNLLVKRENARTAKNWKAADEARDQILAKGFFIEDTPQGARLKRKR